MKLVRNPGGDRVIDSLRTGLSPGLRLQARRRRWQDWSKSTCNDNDCAGSVSCRPKTYKLAGICRRHPNQERVSRDH